jgi:hypothetical protein
MRHRSRLSYRLTGDFASAQTPAVQVRKQKAIIPSNSTVSQVLSMPGILRMPETALLQ